MKKVNVLLDRVLGIKKDLRFRVPHIFEEQKHLDNGEARDYWHYGYMMAIRDILNSFDVKEKKKARKK